jgi:hypothetical protein
MRRSLIISMIVAWVAGTVALVTYASRHPPTGPDICNPVACQPNPNYTPSSPPATPSPVTPVALPTAGPDAWWRAVNACHLLTTSQERALGFGAKRLVTRGDGVCALVEPPVPNQLILSVPLRLTIDLADYPYPLLGVISRQSFQAADGRGGVIARDQSSGECEVTLAATKGSSVLIYVSGSPRDCQVATQAATFISPELPRSGIAR